jgi:hypothetical protein
MRRGVRICVCFGLLAHLLAADPVRFADLPPVPNPYGFDDRLALRSHLEDTLHRTDLAGLSLDDLLVIYRQAQPPALATAATSATPASLDATSARRRELAFILHQRFHLEAAADENAEDLARRIAAAEIAEADQLRRQNLTLQLRQQFHVSVDPAASTDDLARQLDACRAAVPSAAGRPAAANRKSTDTPAAAPPVADQPIRATRRAITGKVIPLTALKRPEGVTSAVAVELERDHLVGISFNRSLDGELTQILAYAAGTMAQAKAASTCLILLGHGDGTHIGMGETPVDLINHLKANREAYHTLLGVSRIDCVAVLSCSRSSDRQFLAFRDGLGYYPTWRVSAWENTYQNAISGLGALSLVLSQDGKEDFRAAVYHGDQAQVASLAEVGNRAATRYLAVSIGEQELVLTPVRRR